MDRCLEDEMNGKHDRMKLVARQSQLLSSITELAVSLRRPPQDVVPALFLRLDVSSASLFIQTAQKNPVEGYDFRVECAHRNEPEGNNVCSFYTVLSLWCNMVPQGIRCSKSCRN